MLVLSMSSSLPLLPEPMVKMCPSNSLQAPTSVVFLGIVAVMLLPRAPRPRPPLPPFLPRPPWPAGAARAIFFNLRHLMDSPEMALVLVALAFLRQAIIRAELFVPPCLLAPISRPMPWGTIPRQSNALWGPHARSQQFARALVPDGFARNAWMGLDGCPCLCAWS
jgi:hypothetical protein